jgi:alpha-glucosidase
VQGLSLSGVSFCGSDAGGFVGSPSQRLYTRWMELGAFTPFFRGHTHVNTPDQEPWAFGDEVERWVNDIISLRYELLPFFYNEFYNSSQTGVPIVRSMFLNYQDDDECYSDAAQYQYMIGDNLLVAPVLSETEDAKKLYLPEGKWLDWWTNKVYEGSQWIFIQVPINRIPLFIREGGVIPLQEKQNYVGEKKIKEMEFRIFPSVNSTFTLYEDDGKTLGYRNGNYLLTGMDIKNNKELQVDIRSAEGSYNPVRDSYLLNVYRARPVKNIIVNGISLNYYESLDKLEKADSGYSIDPDNNLLSIKVKSSGTVKISVE